MKAMPVSPVPRKPFQLVTSAMLNATVQIQKANVRTQKAKARSEADRQSKLEADTRAEAIATITNRLLFDENITPEEKALLKERLKAITVSKK